MSINRKALKRDTPNVVIFRGDGLRLVVPVSDCSGDPVDITGAQDIQFAVAKTQDDAPIFTKVLGDGIAKSNPSTFIVTIEGADSALLTETVYWPEYQAATQNKIDSRSIRGSYYYEARVIIDDGTPYTVISGRMFARESLIEGASL